MFNTPNAIAKQGSDFALLLMESSAENGNVLTKTSLDTLWELDALVKDFEVGA